MTMHFFVNLPLSYAAADQSYLEMIVGRGICPELGMDTVAVQDLPESWHIKTAALLREKGLACSVHLPFFDLHPGSLNDAVLEASRATLYRAAGLARLYGPCLLVGHPAYDRGQHPPRHDEWLRRSTETWRTVREHAAMAPLRLENTHDISPEPLAALIDELTAKGGEDGGAGICFDAGHWFSFGRGSRDPAGLEKWLDVFGTRIRHMHLHDNDGSDDQHLGLGSGRIPWSRIFAGLEQRGVRATVTLEPHSEKDFDTSMRFLQSETSAVQALRRVALPRS
jgi:sugar phosphate isomerase/epimerase